MAAGVHHVQADEQAGLHLLNVLPDALGAVPGVHQIQGSAQQVGGVEGVDHLRGHHADHRDDIALFHPQRLQGGGGLFYLHDQVGIAELAAVVFQRGVAQMPLVVAADQLKGRALRHGLVDVLFLIIFQPWLCLGGIDRLSGGFRHRIRPFFILLFSFLFSGLLPGAAPAADKKGSLPWWKAAGMLLHQRGQDLSFRIVVEPQGKVNKQTGKDAAEENSPSRLRRQIPQGDGF